MYIQSFHTFGVISSNRIYIKQLKHLSHEQDPRDIYPTVSGIGYIKLPAKPALDFIKQFSTEYNLDW